MLSKVRCMSPVSVNYLRESVPASCACALEADMLYQDFGAAFFLVSVFVVVDFFAAFAVLFLLSSLLE